MQSQGSSYIGLFHTSPKKQVVVHQALSSSNQPAKNNWNIVKANISKDEVFTSLSQLNTWRTDNIALMVKAAESDKDCAFLMRVNIEHHFSKKIRALRYSLRFLQDSSTTAETLTEAEYKIDHWKIRQAKLRELYNDTACSIEMRCWAKLIRAQLLHEYNRMNMPLLNDINQSDAKVKKLSFELITMVAQMPFALRSEAKELLRAVEILIPSTDQFRQRLLSVSEHTLYRIFDSFQDGLYQKVVDEVERYLRHDTIRAEKNYRHWARYIRIVASYQLYQQDPENEVKRRVFINACESFIFRYQDKEENFMKGAEFFSYACVYYNKFLENNNLVEMTKNNSFIIQKTVIDWHFDFEATFNESLRYNMWYPGLTEDEIKRIDPNEVLKRIKEDLSEQLGDILNISSESDSSRTRTYTGSINGSNHSSTSAAAVSLRMRASTFGGIENENKSNSGAPGNRVRVGTV